MRITYTSTKQQHSHFFHGWTYERRRVIGGTTPGDKTKVQRKYDAFVPPVDTMGFLHCSGWKVVLLKPKNKKFKWAVLVPLNFETIRHPETRDGRTIIAWFGMCAQLLRDPISKRRRLFSTPSNAIKAAEKASRKMWAETIARNK